MRKNGLNENKRRPEDMSFYNVTFNLACGLIYNRVAIRLPKSIGSTHRLPNSSETVFDNLLVELIALSKPTNYKNMLLSWCMTDTQLDFTASEEWFSRFTSSQMDRLHVLIRSWVFKLCRKITEYSPRDKAALELFLWPNSCHFSTRNLTAINGRAVNGRMSGRFGNKSFNLCACLFLFVPPKQELDSGSDDNFSWLA